MFIRQLSSGKKPLMRPTVSVAFPMYGISRDDVEALWRALRPLLVEEGLPADGVALQWPADLLAHWREPGLLLSQTCGYPLMTALPDVQPVGCFHYAAPGCEGIGYRSFLVTRKGEPGASLEDFRQRRAVCNSADSQSGHHALMAMVAPLAAAGHFFSEVSFSGSHEQSLRILQQGAADIAAIDCVTYALLQRHRPQTLHGLNVVGRTPLYPGLPLITQPHASPGILNALRAALQRLVSEPEHHDVCRALLIEGFSPVSRRHYEVILRQRASNREQRVIAPRHARG